MAKWEPLLAKWTGRAEEHRHASGLHSGKMCTVGMTESGDLVQGVVAQEKRPRNVGFVFQRVLAARKEISSSLTDKQVALLLGTVMAQHGKIPATFCQMLDLRERGQATPSLLAAVGTTIGFNGVHRPGDAMSRADLPNIDVGIAQFFCDVHETHATDDWFVELLKNAVTAGVFDLCRRVMSPPEAPLEEEVTEETIDDSAVHAAQAQAQAQAQQQLAQPQILAAKAATAGKAPAASTPSRNAASTPSRNARAKARDEVRADARVAEDVTAAQALMLLDPPPAAAGDDSDGDTHAFIAAIANRRKAAPKPKAAPKAAPKRKAAPKTRKAAPKARKAAWSKKRKADDDSDEDDDDDDDDEDEFSPAPRPAAKRAPALKHNKKAAAVAAAAAAAAADEPGDISTVDVLTPLDTLLATSSAHGNLVLAQRVKQFKSQSSMPLTAKALAVADPFLRELYKQGVEVGPRCGAGFDAALRFLPMAVDDDELADWVRTNPLSGAPRGRKRRVETGLQADGSTVTGGFVLVPGPDTSGITYTLILTQTPDYGIPDPVQAILCLLPVKAMSNGDERVPTVMASMDVYVATALVDGRVYASVFGFGYAASGPFVVLPNTNNCLAMFSPTDDAPGDILSMMQHLLTIFVTDLASPTWMTRDDIGQVSLKRQLPLAITVPPTTTFSQVAITVLKRAVGCPEALDESHVGEFFKWFNTVEPTINERVFDDPVVPQLPSPLVGMQLGPNFVSCASYTHSVKAPIGMYSVDAAARLYECTRTQSKRVAAPMTDVRAQEVLAQSARTACEATSANSNARSLQVQLDMHVAQAEIIKAVQEMLASAEDAPDLEANPVAQWTSAERDALTRYLYVQERVLAAARRRAQTGASADRYDAAVEVASVLRQQLQAHSMVLTE